MAGDPAIFKQSARSEFGRFLLRHRHYLTSVIICSQAYRQIPLFIRVNAQQVSIFRIKNKKELQAIEEELDADFGNAMEIVNKAGQYDFLTVNFDKKEKYHHNFNPLGY